MKTPWTLWTGTALLAGALAGWAGDPAPQGGPMGGPPMGGGMGGPMGPGMGQGGGQPGMMGGNPPGMSSGGQGLMNELGLSKESAKAIKDKMHEVRKQMIQLKSERDLAKADLEHLLEADTLDEKALQEATDKLANINAQITKSQISVRVEIAKLLAPEQRSKLMELRKGIHERRETRMENRRGGMGGGGSSGGFGGGGFGGGWQAPSGGDDLDRELDF